VLAVLLRRWRRRAAVASAEAASPVARARASGVDASDEELARLEAAVRGGDE
jgi:hypothetical protein